MVLQIEQLKRASHISCLEQAIIRWRHPTDIGIQEHVEHRIDDIGDLLLAAIVVNDNLIKSLEVSEVVADEASHFLRHPAHEGIVLRILALLEHEGLIPNIAEAHEREQVPEEPPSSRQIKRRIILLATDERGRVNGMAFVEAHFRDMSPQVIYL